MDPKISFFLDFELVELNEFGKEVVVPTRISPEAIEQREINLFLDDY